jgi:hypothetical protein
MKADDFYLRVAHALSGCQVIEQVLKLYISEALQLVQKCVSDKFPFTMTGEDFQDAPLGRLIDIFAKLSDNPSLVGELRIFKTERNFLSHRAITQCLDRDGELDDGAVDQIENRLAKIQLEANRLRIAIHEEANKFRGHLWFEKLPNAG